MSIKPPNLDDRDFRQLVDLACRRIRESCPGWTDLSPADPGVTLLEVFAHLTEVLIYRVNRIPEKAFVEFLRLIGVCLLPPTAAKVELRFDRSRAGDSAIRIPRGTRVTLARTGGGQRPVSFQTARTVTLSPSENSLEVPAFHCDFVEGELAGRGTGLAGQAVQATHVPLIAPTGSELDLMVGVETDDTSLDGRARAVEWQGKPFRIWREVESFVDLGTDRFVYRADRFTGAIHFAPSAQMKTSADGLEASPGNLAEVPGAGREIRLWYAHGGGADGNVAAGLITVLRDPIPGLAVINPAPATGGRDGETLENALVRGPQELRSLSRAVTARDYELVALRASGAAARAKAFTMASLWAHAGPGTVEVLLVPALPESAQDGGRVTMEALASHQTETERLRIADELDRRRPLGTICRVNWVRYKPVRIRARVVAHLGESLEAVRSRVLDRLNAAINPLPSARGSGWRFGYPLRASHVYDLLLSDPGVSYADEVRLVVDDVPEREVASLAADHFQKGAWFAVSGPTLFRTLDDGSGWEAAGRFPDEELRMVKPHRGRAGLVAVTTVVESESGASRVHVSFDCGETWRRVAQTGFAVFDMDWMTREGAPVLLLATDVGLFELAMQVDAVPIQMLVDPTNQDLGFYAVTTSIDPQGEIAVAVAARGGAGVFLSTQRGRTGTFARIGLEGEDVRVLSVQEVGPLRFLWAGLAVPGRAAGKGCYRWELRPSSLQLEGAFFSQGWEGGTCWAIAFQGRTLLAATDQAGVLTLDTAASDPAWQAPVAGCGLPLREVGKFHPIRALATDSGQRLVMSGSGVGVHRSPDRGLTYEGCSRKEFMETVTLPETWLFCSAEHDIEVVSEHEPE